MSRAELWAHRPSNPVSLSRQLLVGCGFLQEDVLVQGTYMMRQLSHLDGCRILCSFQNNENQMKSQYLYQRYDSLSRIMTRDARAFPRAGRDVTCTLSQHPVDPSRPILLARLSPTSHPLFCPESFRPRFQITPPCSIVV